MYSGDDDHVVEVLLCIVKICDNAKNNMILNLIRELKGT